MPYSTDVIVPSPATKAGSSASYEQQSLCRGELGYYKKPTQFQDGKPKEADHFGVGRGNTT